MKKFILSVGEELLSLFVIIAILIGVAFFFYGVSTGELFYGLFTGIALIVGVIIATFLLYLLIDIRDKSKETNELLSKLIDDNKLNG